MNFSFFLCLAAFRTRSSAWDTPARIYVRSVLYQQAFPLVPALDTLGSATSAAGSPALFGSFVTTMARSDFSCRCIIGFGSSPCFRLERVRRVGFAPTGKRRLITAHTLNRRRAFVEEAWNP